MSVGLGLPSPAQVREQLAILLASKALGQSPRLSRFLRFVVQSAVEGSGQYLKESTIAVQVFDRDPSYEPRTDPIVRVQAVRLRSKLVEHYATEGRADPVIIEVPVGGYVPSFRLRVSGEEPAPERRSIAVLPFVDLSPDWPVAPGRDGSRGQRPALG